MRLKISILLMTLLTGIISHTLSAQIVSLDMLTRNANTDVKLTLKDEMMGYNPHKKTYTIKSHWDAYDLRIIKMEENPEFLEAASISER